MQYKIRSIKSGDIKKVIIINRACLPENYEKVFFSTHFKKYPDLFFVAVIGGKVSAYAMAKVDPYEDKEVSQSRNPKTQKNSIQGHLLSMAVIHGYRRKGVGNALLNAVIKGFKARNIKLVHLEVRVSNKAAQDLYLKNGFKKELQVPHYYKDGEDALIMRKYI